VYCSKITFAEQRELVSTWRHIYITKCDPVQGKNRIFHLLGVHQSPPLIPPFPISGNPKYFQNASLLSFSYRLHSSIQQVKACNMVPRPDCQLDWRSSDVAVMLRFDGGLRSKTQASSGPLSHHVPGIIMIFLGFSKKNINLSRPPKQLRNNHTLSPQ
jgi:hypothetical protein